MRSHRPTSRFTAMSLGSKLLILAASALATGCAPTAVQILIAYQSPYDAAEKIGHTITISKKRPSLGSDNDKVFFLAPGPIEPVVITSTSVEAQEKGISIAKQAADNFLMSCQDVSKFDFSSIKASSHRISFEQEILPNPSNWIFINTDLYCDTKTGKIRKDFRNVTGVITGIYRTESSFELNGTHRVAAEKLRACADSKFAQTGFSASTTSVQALQIKSHGWNYVTIKPLGEICAIFANRGTCPEKQIKLADGTCVQFEQYQHTVCSVTQEMSFSDLQCRKLSCNNTHYISNHKCQPCPAGTSANAESTACLLSLGSEQKVWSSEINTPQPNLLCPDINSQISVQFQFPEKPNAAITGKLFCGSVGSHEYDINLPIDDAGSMTGLISTHAAGQGTPSVSFPITLAFKAPPYLASITVGPEPTQILQLNLRPGPLPPRILEFSVDRSEIVAGSTAKLTWRVNNAQSISIGPSVVTGLNAREGIMVIQPTSSITYRLIATNESASQREKLVTVSVVPPNCPRRITFEAAPQDLAANPSLVQKPEFSPYVGGDPGFTYGIHRALKNLDAMPKRVNIAKYNVRFFDSGAVLNTDCKYRLFATFAAKDSRSVDITIDSEFAQRLMTAAQVLGQTTSCWDSCAMRSPIGEMTFTAGSRQFWMKVERDWAFPHIYLFDLDLEK